jgi:ATP-dependent Clp protease ATP-binding subunit ClpX
MKGKKSIGFHSNYNLLDKQKSDNEILHSILPEDIINYGFLPELVGRLGLITVLDPLTKEDMLDILLSTENSIISQQKSLAELENFKIEFTEEAINSIVDKAVQSGMGARRLKSIVSSSTEQIFFDLSGQRRFYNKVIRILEDTINDPSKYEIVKKQAKVKDNIIKDNEVKDNVKEG